MLTETLAAEVKSATADYEAAIKTRDTAESHARDISGRRAKLVKRNTVLQTETVKLADTAIDSVDSNDFATAVARVVESEGRARFLALAIAHTDNVPLRNARRAVLVAVLVEAESLEVLAKARLAEHEEQVKAELKRSARLLGNFETQGFGSRHEELLDALETAQNDVRFARQALDKFDSGVS